jgi:CheY-like chemotaxis protein
MSPKFNCKVIPLSDVPWKDPIHLGDLYEPLVLVVDDERLIADTLSVILGRHGYEVITAYNGSEALDLARDTAPDLLISDVMMPGLSGVELAIAMAQLIPKCKVLLFSGQSSTMDLLDEARQIGHNFRLLLKPMDPAEMLRNVSECLAPPMMFAGATETYGMIV